MGLFTIGDITITGGSSGLWSLDGTGLMNDTVNSYNMKRFPSDLGSIDKGHYMIIFINQQIRTQYQTPLTSDVPTKIDNMVNKKGIGDVTSIFSPTNNLQRTSASIALYMPDTLGFDNVQSYGNIGLGKGLMGLGLTGAQSIVDSIRNKSSAKDIFSNAVNNASSAIGAVASVAAGALQVNGISGSDLYQGAMGKAQNPMTEIIYSSPEFRHFNFTFTMHPRSKKEAEELQEIIYLLRYHQAPEIDKSTNGFFMIPPSEFDIKFYYNGHENPNIDKISTCVLEGINVDYAPNGFAAYEVVGEPAQIGGTGMPVAIRLTLSFKETEYMTKENYKKMEFGATDNNGGLDMDRVLGVDAQETPTEVVISSDTNV